MLIGLVVAFGFSVPGSAPARAGFFDDLFSVQKSHRSYNRKQYRKRQYRKKRRARKRRYRPKKPTGPNPLLANVPDLPASEPVQIVISLPTQNMTVYKGGIEIATTRVSSGQPGYRTPAGVFSILQKKLRHYSNLYDDAPMPYMQRLTWSGIALHAGKVPDYPASHGCIRMPHKFARNLYGITDKGGHVVVSNAAAPLEIIDHPKLFQPAPLATIFGPEYIATKPPGQSAEAVSTPGEPAFEGTHLRTVATSEPKAAKPAKTKSVKRAAAHAERERFHGAKPGTDAPIRVLITLRNREEQIRDVQRRLAEFGFRPGAIDGVIGRDTIRAIEKFQAFKRLPVTGEVSPELIAILNGAAGEWSYPTGHIYIRQNMREIFHAPVTITNPDEPIGTHLYTAMHFKADALTARWTGVTLQHYASDSEDTEYSEYKGGSEVTVVDDTDLAIVPDHGSARDVLDRIEVPEHIRRQIGAMLTPGSSLIVTDKGAGRETIDGTDFLVITR
ncbi:MAG: L,D-transpeptidase family protein [Hyphomicrobiales bacterium]